ncbi:hypothetical protein AVEN_184116-1, partial [Araneus ventricosus]
MAPLRLAPRASIPPCPLWSLRHYNTTAHIYLLSSKEQLQQSVHPSKL